MKKQFENFSLYAPRSCKLFVNIGDDDAATCAFSGGCWEINGTAVKTVCGGLKILLLNIAKINIPLRFKENMINFYFYYFN